MPSQKRILPDTVPPFIEPEACLRIKRWMATMDEPVNSGPVPSPAVSMPTTLSTPFLGQPVEICIVTANMRETLSGLVRLGIGPFKIYQFNSKTVTEQTLHGEPAPFELEVAFATQGKMVWEVMRPVSGNTLMQQFLDDTNGRGGIQHVAFDFGDGENDTHASCSVPRTGKLARSVARRRRAEFEERGFPLAQSGVWAGRKGTCEFMFFDTQGAIGTCFETYVFSDDWEDPEGEVFPPGC